MSAKVTPQTIIGYLGPAGTFTEQALRSEPDLAAAQLVPMTSFAEALNAVTSGQAGYAFVALENSIEGTVAVTLDQLVFEQDLLIVREVVLPVTQNLLGRPGSRLDEIRAVTSYPHAIAQVRGWLRHHLPGVEERATSSTAEAARLVGQGGDPTVAAIGTPLAAELYGLEVLAADIEDHAGNVTRFALVGPYSAGIPAATGHDKTSVVCFQASDQPGSLHGILGQFSARNINLVKLESRPTKKALGDYCFVIDFEGHLADEVVGDCLRDLHATLRELKFLGSYPAAGEDGEDIRRDARASWRAADAWMEDLRAIVETSER